MRDKLLLSTVLGGLCFGFLFACSDTPSKNLHSAQQEFVRLQQSAVAHYISDELTEIEQRLGTARKLLAERKPEPALAQLNRAWQLIEKTSPLSRERAASAESASENRLEDLKNQIVQIRQLVIALPGKSYFDQNRKDRMLVALRNLEREHKSLTKLHAEGDYRGVVEMTSVLERRMGAISGELHPRFPAPQTILTHAKAPVSPVPAPHTVNKASGGAVVTIAAQKPASE
jgi:hypothetical protein